MPAPAKQPVGSALDGASALLFELPEAAMPEASEL
jgi:hypothetical protein